jgi:NtrC-family two-component system sensor histidine kinase KinB
MIASQASVAIQNARLYANTDKALARRVQEMDSILRTVREGILLLDPGGYVLAVNRALADFVGIPRLAMIDGPASIPQVDGFPSLFERIGYTERDFRMDCSEILYSDQEEFKVETITISGLTEIQLERTITPVRDSRGNVTGWLLVFRDLTDEINLEHEREDMLHMLIHDLRSPLSVLQGSLNTIKSSLEDGNIHNVDDLLRLAQRGSDRVLRLVNELLDIGKLESDQISLDCDWLDVKSLVGDVSSQMAPAAERAKISLEVMVEGNLPSMYVDRKYIERVLINLLDNAVKFTSDGGHIVIWARLEPDHEPLSVLIGVTDTGPGIPKETQDRLFGKFQQVSTIHGRRSGTGLGLHYCKLAVEAHGGNIWVDSEPGEGSTFTLRLPVD